MPRYGLTYNSARKELEREVEADAYRMTGKLFEFIKDPEVILMVKADMVLQLKVDGTIRQK